MAKENERETTGSAPRHTRKIDERHVIKEQTGRLRSVRYKEKKMEEYRRKDKEVKASARADKRRRINEIAQEAEMAANDNRIGDLYRLTKEITRNRRNMVSFVKDKSGKLLVNEEVLKRWKQHFDEVLNVQHSIQVTGITGRCSWERMSEYIHG